jgi:hypothetical protein
MLCNSCKYLIPAHYRLVISALMGTLHDTQKWDSKNHIVLAPGPEPLSSGIASPNLKQGHRTVQTLKLPLI